jgi:hypothetical protein
MQGHPNACVCLQGRHWLVSQHLKLGRGLPQPPAAPEAHRPAASGSLLHRRQGPQTAPPGALAVPGIKTSGNQPHRRSYGVGSDTFPPVLASHLLPRVGLRHGSPELRGAERLAATPPGDLIYIQH